MKRICPRCRSLNRPAARFCASCGLSLAPGSAGALAAGRIRHPRPLPAPEQFEPCAEAVDLFFRWEAAWGGRVLLGTEGIGVVLFNGGHPLQQVVLKVRGRDEQGGGLFAVEQTVPELPRGEQVRIEIPSYELPAPVRAVSVALLSAEFGPEG